MMSRPRRKQASVFACQSCRAFLTVDLCDLANVARGSGSICTLILGTVVPIPERSKLCNILGLHSLNISS